MSNDALNLFNLKDGKIKTLHLAWIAFFLTFVIWFNHAPLLTYMKAQLGLTDPQIKALLILNVALTIPARIVIGMLVDRFGPRRVYSGVLMGSSVICFGFAAAQNFEQLAIARLLLGFVGCGFVIGIRLVGEWFPARQVGLAEGIYGGWGNFGASGAALVLPALAVAFGGPSGWRYAVAATGVIAFAYGIFFYVSARDTPKGSTYFKPKRSGGLEVTSKKDFVALLSMNVPMYLALGLTVWRLGKLGMLGEGVSLGLYAGLCVLLALQIVPIVRVNRELFVREVPRERRYKFKQVAILAVAYTVSFGSELAVVSMLPLFFLETYKGLSPVKAAMFASSFAFMNLVARPGGGWLSDRFGRRKTLSLLIAGLAVGYFALGRVNSSWPLPLAVLTSMGCSFCVQAACGAVFAVVPLVQRRMTGQIAGLVGAYGNVGGVLFLTALSFVDYSTFFKLIGATSGLAFVAAQFLDEPKGHMAEVLEDGTVQLLEVS